VRVDWYVSPITKTVLDATTEIMARLNYYFGQTMKRGTVVFICDGQEPLAGLTIGEDSFVAGVLLDQMMSVVTHDELSLCQLQEESIDLTGVITSIPLYVDISDPQTGQFFMNPDLTDFVARCFGLVCDLIGNPIDPEDRDGFETIVRLLAQKQSEQVGYHVRQLCDVEEGICAAVACVIKSFFAYMKERKVDNGMLCLYRDQSPCFCVRLGTTSYLETNYSQALASIVRLVCETTSWAGEYLEAYFDQDESVIGGAVEILNKDGLYLCAMPLCAMPGVSLPEQILSRAITDDNCVVCPICGCAFGALHTLDCLFEECPACGQKLRACGHCRDRIEMHQGWIRIGDSIYPEDEMRVRFGFEKEFLEQEESGS